MRLIAASIFVASVVLVGCGEEPNTGSGPAGERSALESLARGCDFYLSPQGTAMTLNVRSRTGEAQVLSLSGGGFAKLSAARNENINLEQLELSFDDAIVGDKTSPDAIYLTEIGARIDRRAECSHVAWSHDDEQCTATIPSDIIVSWSMQMTDGVAVSLPDLELPVMELGADVWNDGNALAVDLSGQSSPAWGHDDFFAIDEVSLVTSGYELVPMR